MNSDTNRLVANLGSIPELEQKDFTPIPKDLQHAAKVALKGKEEVTISQNSGGKLSNWSKKERNAKRKADFLAGRS